MTQELHGIVSLGGTVISPSLEKRGLKGDTGNGITSIAKTGSSGVTDTYTITFTDNTTTTFTITNGSSIANIAKTGTSGLVDEYTITLTDGSTDTFTVTNGEKGDQGIQGETGNGIDSIELVETSGAVKTYEITYTDGDTFEYDVTDGEITQEQLELYTIVQTNSDNTPYLFRRSGGSVLTGKREYPTLVGGSVVWNQLAKELNSTNWNAESGVTATYSDGVATISSTVSSNGIRSGGHSFINGHKYFVTATLKCANNLSTVKIGGTGATGVQFTTSLTANTEQVLSGIGQATATSSQLYAYASGTYSGLTVKNYMCVDLTAMFGTSIADRAYTMEQATVGSGIAWLKSYGFFTDSYYAYATPSIESVEAVKHITRGKNQINDAYLTYFPIFMPKGTTVIASADALPSGQQAQINYYDADKNRIDYWAAMYDAVNGRKATRAFTLLQDTYYFRFSGDHAQNYQLELGDTATAYEAYDGHEYTLDSDLVLRGVPKLDASNNLYYDGDTYASDGSVVRKYGIRAYQSGDESLADAITDGTNTVYKLATPTTETADPFTSPQVCNPNGTEEYTTNTIVPVGHTTNYPLTLIDTMPNANGIYTMNITVANGKRTIIWTALE